jgi:hypothetical protein
MIEKTTTRCLIALRQGPPPTVLESAVISAVGPVAFVAADAQRCPFLTLELRDERCTVVLEIDAPEDGETGADELLAAMRSGRAAP